MDHFSLHFFSLHFFTSQLTWGSRTLVTSLPTINLGESYSRHLATDDNFGESYLVPHYQRLINTCVRQRPCSAQTMKPNGLRVSFFVLISITHVYLLYSLSLGLSYYWSAIDDEIAWKLNILSSWFYIKISCNLGSSVLQSRKIKMWFRKGEEPITGWRTNFLS